MKNFTSVNDVSNLPALLDMAARYKKDPGMDRTLGQHKRIGLLFFNPSMRTRLSTQIAASNLGMEAIVFNVGQEGWALEFGEDTIMNGTTVEHIRDAAPVLGRYFDILGVRTFPSLKNKSEDYSEQAINQFIRYAGIPVISLESATLHPLQSLADLMTMQALLPAGHKPKVVLTWAPHVKPLPQCVANSFAQWVNAWGKAEFVIAHPKGLDLSKEFTNGAHMTTNQQEAMEGADFVYVKNWSSFQDYGVLGPNDASWMLTPEKMKTTNHGRVMHCLPVRRNVELSGKLLDGPSSLVTEQAANRVWAAQAVIAEILRKMV
ncbi:MAG: acetylornithine carbamoyltransferase [Cyclobacteriaceae bacterium]|nr:acetylornithine carbamoyltransferase [Cyclobacteriaceae bacterium]